MPVSLFYHTKMWHSMNFVSFLPSGSFILKLLLFYDQENTVYLLCASHCARCIMIQTLLTTKYRSLFPYSLQGIDSLDLFCASSTSYLLSRHLYMTEHLHDCMDSLMLVSHLMLVATSYTHNHSFSFFFRARDRSQDLLHARQVLYH
jgi:hypothetical protein